MEAVMGGDLWIMAGGRPMNRPESALYRLGRALRGRRAGLNMLGRALMDWALRCQRGKAWPERFGAMLGYGGNLSCRGREFQGLPLSEKQRANIRADVAEAARKLGEARR